jgi:hypothetical protein
VRCNLEALGCVLELAVAPLRILQLLLLKGLRFRM